MTRSFGALLVSLMLIVPFLASAPSHAQDGALTREEARAIVCFEGSAWHCETMLDIAWRESRLQPGVVNPNCYPEYPFAYACWGLLQHLLPAGVDGTRLLDPRVNVELAHEKYLNGGTAVHWRATQ